MTKIEGGLKTFLVFFLAMASKNIRLANKSTIFFDFHSICVITNWNYQPPINLGA